MRWAAALLLSALVLAGCDRDGARDSQAAKPTVADTLPLTF